MERVAVIGAGTMGNGIAHVCAQAGLRVTLVDVAAGVLENAVATIGKNLDRQVGKGILTQEERDGALARIETATERDLGVEGAGLVVEAIPERAELKYELFAELDRLASPGAILASNTSSISITALAAVTTRPERVIGMHFMNPVPVMKLVEIIRGHRTSDETLALTHALTERLGKTPVTSADYPGFLANRILMPLLNEAAFTVMEGVGTPEDVDRVAKLGLNHPMGPLELADFIGLDVCVAILDVLHEGFGDPKYRACPLLRKMVAAGDLGRKSGRGFFSYAQ